MVTPASGQGNLRPDPVQLVWAVQEIERLAAM